MRGLPADPRGVPLLAGAALAALAVAACGGETRTNGLEKLPARTVEQKALTALRSASSAHVKGTSLVAGRPARIDLRFSGRSSDGTIAADGLRFAFTRVDDAAYVKADGPTLAKLGAPPSLQRIAAHRWLKLGPGRLALSGVSLAAVAHQLAANGSALKPHVAQSTLGGKPAVVVTRQDGSKLYVANAGPAYPLRGDYKGADAARFEFTELGADIRIAAPKDAVSAGASG
jgi:hypothetical protein